MALPTLSSSVWAAQVVLPASPLDPTVAFFTGRLGFRVDGIFPADAPSVAILSGHGLTIRLQPPDEHLLPGVLRVLCADPVPVDDRNGVLVAPNGTRVELVDADHAVVIPPLLPSLVITRIGDDSDWGVGRAGMLYRDIIPGRQGGRFIGSHIRIPNGGPVPDYAHFHKVRFQMIYCHRGWVRLVYEDQGEPFVLEAGDCVLQPPEIRHRVLDCSDGLEVIELGCPADHETLADHEIELPTGRAQPGREFGGQLFVRHEATGACWLPWRMPGFECRDLGIGHATDGLAGVRVARPVSRDPGSGPHDPGFAHHEVELMFFFVLGGSVTFELQDQDSGATGVRRETLTEGDTVVVPAGTGHRLVAASDDLEILDVTLPERFD